MGVLSVSGRRNRTNDRTTSGPFTEQIGGSVLTVLCVLSDAALSDRDDPLSGGATACATASDATRSAGHDVKKPLLIGIVALRRD